MYIKIAFFANKDNLAIQKYKEGSNIIKTAEFENNVKDIFQQFQKTIPTK